MENLNYDYLGGPVNPQENQVRNKKKLKKDPKKLFNIENFTYFVENQENIEKEKIVRKGLNMDDNFWDNFIRICNDSNAFSKLLNVPKEKIVSWAEIIKNQIKEIKRKDQHTIKPNKKLI